MTLGESVAAVRAQAAQAGSFDFDLDPEWRWVGPLPGYVASMLLAASESHIDSSAGASAIFVEFSRRSHAPSVHIELPDVETSFALHRQESLLRVGGKLATRASSAFTRERNSSAPNIGHFTKPAVSAPEQVPTIDEVLGGTFRRQGIIKNFEERPLDWLDADARDPNHDLSGTPGPASFRSWFTLIDGSSPSHSVVRSAAMIIADFAPFLAAKRAHPHLMSQGLQIVSSTSSIHCQFYPFQNCGLTLFCCAESPWTFGHTLVGRVTCFTESMEPILVAQTHTAISIR